MFVFYMSVPLIGMPGLMEWILIGLAVMLLFGATKLPKLGKGLGEGIRNFKTGLKGDPEESEGNKEDSALPKDSKDGDDTKGSA